MFSVCFGGALAGVYPSMQRMGGAWLPGMDSLATGSPTRSGCGLPTSPLGDALWVDMQAKPECWDAWVGRAATRWVNTPIRKTIQQLQHRLRHQPMQHRHHPGRCSTQPAPQQCQSQEQLAAIAGHPPAQSGPNAPAVILWLLGLSPYDSENPIHEQGAGSLRVSDVTSRAAPPGPMQPSQQQRLSQTALRPRHVWCREILRRLRTG